MLTSLWNDLRPATCDERAWSVELDELRARYGEARRHYHTLVHLGEMVALLERERARLAQRTEVLLAAFYHDAVLVPGAKDNEAQSAELARERLAGRLAPDRVERVAGLVLATQTHEVEAGDADRTLLLDADMAILGAPRERYREYARGIRAEYRHVPGPLYRAGRRRFLEAVLARPVIFGDPVLRAELEGAARANLAAELAGAAD